MAAKKMLTFLTISLFIGLAILPAIDSRTTNTKNIITLFQDKSEVSVVHLEASSPYNYGFRAGTLLKTQYRFIDILARLSKKYKIDKEYVENQIDAMEQYCPFLLEELKGLSASTNIKLERLIFLKKFLYYFIDERCISLACTGSATENNEAFLIQKRDSSGLASRMTLMKYLVCSLERIMYKKLHVKGYGDYPSNYKYVFCGVPVLNELPLMNEKGLGVGGSGILITKNESRYDEIDRGKGLTHDILMTLSLTTCKNVSEVANLFKSVERASAICKTQVNPLLAFCDAEGGILMIEYTHNYIATVFGNSTEITGAPEGILWHANHIQWLDPNVTGSVLPENCFVSDVRANRSRELLEEHHGNITLDICKKITRDHGGGIDPNRKDPADICRHTDRHGIAIEILTYIIKPKDLTIYTVHGIPCRHIYREHNFTEIFAE